MKTKLLFKPGQRLFILFIIITFVSTNPLFAQGAGHKLTFDGVDDIVTVPSSSGGSLNPSDSITLECWVNLKEATSATHRPHLISKTGSYGLIIEDNGIPRFFINDGTSWKFVAGTTIVQKNKWYHIAGTFDGKYIKIYVNGKLEGTPTELNSSMISNDGSFNIGNRLNNEEALNGHMDEVRTWTRTRSESQIQRSMNIKLKSDEPGLVGYWRLDTTSVSIVTDSSPSGNNGTLTHMDTINAWTISGAPIGNYSLYSISNSITHTNDCMVDVIFDTENEEGPGDNFSFAAIQINDLPNKSTGLTNVPKQYWHLWSENPLFDGTFSATINFHYDNIFGIQEESNLELYRRQYVASPTWVKVKGYTIETGSSTTDGKGYIQWKISQDTLGGFSGEYIISGNNPLIIEDPTEKIDISLFPNPNHGTFELAINLEENQNIDIEIYSMNGKVIWKEIYLNQTGYRKYPVDITGQAKGVYFLKVNTKAGFFTKQLILQ
jgi:hypothetical protein